MSVDAIVGDNVSASDASIDGAILGAFDALYVDWSVAVNEGENVGATVGHILGLYLGVFVGDGIGLFVRASIGGIGDTITFVVYVLFDN